MARLQLDYLPLRDVRASDDLLGIVSFNVPHPLATLTLPGAQLGPEPLVEVWRGEGARLITASSDEACLECGTRRVYEHLFQAAGDFHLIRIWNHIAGLNDGDGDAERYRRFCIGRHEAFTAAGWSKERFPSASGVGMREGALAVYALAAGDQGVQVENPRQVSAYEYPRSYGPRSPSFARATIAAGLLLTAGTSSVGGRSEERRVGKECRSRWSP